MGLGAAVDSIAQANLHAAGAVVIISVDTVVSVSFLVLVGVCARVFTLFVEIGSVGVRERGFRGAPAVMWDFVAWV